MRYVNTLLLAFVTVSVSNAAFAQSEACAALDRAIIINSDGKYIGKISNKYDSDSIFNKYGQFGSKYQSESIWNKYGENGSEYNLTSWLNKHSSDAPKIIKDRKIIGFLTVNKSLQGALNPIIIGAICFDFDPS